MTLTDEQLAEMQPRLEFLLETARYFRKRPTGGEDRAHWANIYNAENCEKAAKEFRALIDEVERLRKCLGHANREADRLLLGSERLSQRGTPPSSPGELP